MRLPPGRRAFAAMTLFKFHFSNPLPPTCAAHLWFYLHFWQNVIHPPTFSDDHTPLASLPRDNLFQHKCSYHRFHFTSSAECIIVFSYLSLLPPLFFCYADDHRRGVFTLSPALFHFIT